MHRKRGAGRTWAVFALALSWISLALPVGTASAQTVLLRPNVDIDLASSTDWAVVGAASYWDALDDALEQPQVPTNSDYIKHLTKKGRPRVGLTSAPLLGYDVAIATAWYYTPTAKAVILNVKDGATNLASKANSSAGWHSISIPLNGTQSQLDNLSLQFEEQSSSGGEVYAAYVELQLNEHPRVYWGAWMNGATVYGPGFSDAPWDSATWTEFEKHAGKSASLIHFGQMPPWIAKFDSVPLDKAYEKGAIPLMDMANDLYHYPAHVSLKEIDEGKVDAAWTAWAEEVADYGKPFFFRWDWEMNGTWFPYGKEMMEVMQGSATVEEKRLFQRVWKRLWHLADSAGAKNITWVWCPNTIYPGSTDLQYLNPGSTYVDWNCIDGYNEGAPSWRTFSQIFTETYSLLDGKPVMIAETASAESGGSKAAWIQDTFLTQIPVHFPKIKAIAWFNWNSSNEWAIESSPAATASFASAISSPFYASGEFGSLPPLTKIQPLP